MRDIRRPDKAEPLVELLTSARRGEDGQATFDTIMDLLIFAAGIGFSFEAREAVPSASKGIPYLIFERNQKDGYIYVLALAATDNPEVLTAEKADFAVEIFEEYAAGGLDLIQRWLNENPTDVTGVQTLMSHLVGKLKSAESLVETRPNPI